MQTVTNEQIYDRWEQIPEKLKEAFFSIENGESIWRECEGAGLAEDAIDNVLVVVGNVLFGFTHVNDLAKELQSIPGMDLKAVDPLIFQIDTRILAPLKGDILKLYGAMSGTGPKMVVGAAPELVKESLSVPAEGSRPEPSADGQNASDQPMILAEHAPSMASVESQTAQLEIRKVKIGGEGEAPAKIGEQQIEAPSIIHSEVTIAPVAQKKHALSSFGGMFGFRKGMTERKEGPAVTAQVSMIEGVGKKPDEMAHTEQQPIRVVHYTDVKAPESMFGAMPNPGIQPAVPITKQEHDFEPKVVNLAEHPATRDSISQGEAAPIVPAVIAVPVPVIAPVFEVPVAVQAQTMEMPAPKEAIIPPIAAPQQSAIPDGAMPYASRPEPAEGLVLSGAEGSRPEPAEGSRPDPSADGRSQPQGIQSGELAATVMKTPQRPEVSDEPKQQEPAPRLAEIPIADDVVDLRLLERITDKK